MNNIPNKHHIVSTGAGIAGCREAYRRLIEIYDFTQKTFKRKPETEFFVAGTCNPNKDMPVYWSIVGYGDNIKEIEFIIDNV